MDNQKHPEQLTLDGFTVDSGRETDANPPRPGENATTLDSPETDDSAVEPGAKYIAPTTEQWAALYKIAMEIRQLEPWYDLWSSELIMIELPEHEEPFFCCTMGANADCYAVAVYPGYQGLKSYERLQSGEDDVALLSVGCEQICMICYFGDREEVTPVDREIYNSLGIKFRGRNEWIYFRSQEPGFYPWYLNTEEADILIRVLKHYTRAFSYMVKNKLEVDFDEGEILARYYSPEDKIWLNEAVLYPDDYLYKHKSLLISDDLFIRRLLRQKRNNQSLEFDMSFLAVPFRDKKGERPHLSRLIAFADRKSGMPFGIEIVRDGEETVEKIIDMFVSYIEQFGRPTRIYIRNDIARYYVGDLCEKLEIKLIEGEGIPALDEFYLELDEKLSY